MLRPVKKLWTTAWKKNRDRAGVQKRGHDTRAAFLTSILSMGKGINVAKDLAGHENINTTMFYVKAANSELKNAVDDLAKLRPLENPLDPHTKTAHRIIKGKADKD